MNETQESGGQPAPELTGLSPKGYPGVTRTLRAAHLSTQVGAFLFKDQGQALFVVSGKEPIDLLQPARDKAAVTPQLVGKKQKCW